MKKRKITRRKLDPIEQLQNKIRASVKSFISKAKLVLVGVVGTLLVIWLAKVF